jgi:hypothetical protein
MSVKKDLKDIASKTTLEIKKDLALSLSNKFYISRLTLRYIKNNRFFLYNYMDEIID